MGKTYFSNDHGKDVQSNNKNLYTRRNVWENVDYLSKFLPMKTL